MSKIKKIIAVVTATALLAAGAYEGFGYLQRKNIPEATVVEVGELESLADTGGYYYFQDSSITGDIVTDVMQQVKVDKDVVIKEVFVKEGDPISSGTLMFTVDNTIPAKKLYIEEMKLEYMNITLENQRNNLYILQNGGIPKETKQYSGFAFSVFPLKLASAIFAGELIEPIYPDNNITDISEQTSDISVPADNISYDSELIIPQEEISGSGELIAEDIASGQDTYVNDTTASEYEDISDELETEITDTIIETPSYTEPQSESLSELFPEEYPISYEEPDISSGDIGSETIIEEPVDIGDKDPVFYSVLDDESIPYVGTGTETDPYVYLCSGENVILKGTFINKMAGYDPGGTEQLNESGYRYIAEFHANDEITTEEDRTVNRTGYYDIYGKEEGFIPRDPEEEITLTLENAIKGEYFKDEVSEEGNIPEEQVQEEPEKEIPDELTDEIIESELENTDDELKEEKKPEEQHGATGGDYEERTMVPVPDGEEIFYSVLDADSIPYEGSGSEDDPFIYLCAGEEVILKGSFRNLMAGYNPEGTELIHEGGYWYLLEFHEDDMIEDPEERTLSRIGYYLENGAEETDEPVDPDSEIIKTLDEADSDYDDEEYDDEEYYDDEYYDDEYYDDEYYSEENEAESLSPEERDTAIKEKEQEIRTLEHDIKETELNISKLRKNAETTEVYSKLDGTVAFVGDAGNPAGKESFVDVRSGSGFFVKGLIGESIFHNISIGGTIKCTTGMGESFEAKIIDVADYPEAATDNYYGYENERSESQYSFTAEISDKNYIPNRDTYITSITLPEENNDEKGITIFKAYVRSDNGKSFVMKDDNGVLKKQYVKISKIDQDMGTVTIIAGIKRTDRITFPYSETAKEGTKTKQGKPEDMYSEDYSEI